MCWEFAEHKTQQRCNVDLRKLYRPVIWEPWTVHGMGKALHDISTNCPSIIVVKLRGSTNVKYVGPWSCAVGTKGSLPSRSTKSTREQVNTHRKPSRRLQYLYLSVHVTPMSALQ